MPPRWRRAWLRGYIVPGPRGARAQGARKGLGFRVKFWYRTQGRF